MFTNYQNIVKGFEVEDKIKKGRVTSSSSSVDTSDYNYGLVTSISVSGKTDTVKIGKTKYEIDEDSKDFTEGTFAIFTLDKDKKVVDGNVLFKPYVSQYNSWRDGCISKAEDMLKNNKDIIIFSLDIKGYYNSISLDFTEILFLFPFSSTK